MVAQRNEQTRNEQDPRFLTIVEIARILRVKKESARLLIVVDNKIPFIRVGRGKRGAIRVEENDFLNYLKENRVPAAGEQASEEQ